MGTKVICISREFGSGGHEIGVTAAEEIVRRFNSLT